MKYQNENFNGDLDFRSRFHHGWWMETHLHEYSEILYCKSGEGNVTVNGTSICLCQGQFIWLPPNCVHQYDFQEAELVCAVFSNDLIPLFFVATHGKRPVVSALKAGELSPLLEQLYRLDKADCLRISGYLNLIGAKVAEEAAFVDGSCSDIVLYQKVITYLSEHYTEQITLSQIAKLFGYHEKYLSHALHDLTGIHFRQMLGFYRVNRAKQLLLETPQTSITQIAMNSGFSAINTFNRVFREMTGLTPSQYRKKHGAP